MFLTKQDIFCEDQQQLEKRIFRRLSKWEVGLLAFNLGLLLVFMKLFSQGYPGFSDYQTYLRAAAGDIRGFYYPYWTLLIFKMMRSIPFYAGILIWGSANLLGIFFAARVFGNQPAFVLFSYQVMYVLFYGQITGLVIAGLGLVWVGIRTNQPTLAGAGVLLAAIKFHVGLPLGLALILMSWEGWQKTLRILFMPLMIGLLTLLIRPHWPMELFRSSVSFPPSFAGSISLWKYMGPIALLFLLPCLLFPYTRQERYAYLAISLGLALPYFQQTELLALFVQPIGWTALLGNLGFGFILYEWRVFVVLTGILLIGYGNYLRIGLVRLIQGERPAWWDSFQERWLDG